MKIGNVTLKNNILLAPMAGITDIVFRRLCHEQGCGMTFTEMVSAKAILYNNPKTELLFEIHPEEGPVGIQLFGNDPTIIAEMAGEIDNDLITLFDINMGCPVPKVFNNNEGSALMKNPKLVGEIVRKMSDTVKKPVTVKIRKGINNNIINAVEIAKIAEANGASAVTVHGRTREQYYSGKADLEIIKKVKEAVKIPVIGNGDIFGAKDAEQMLEYTGCDGIMVARGAQGNPWIFKEILNYFETGIILPKPNTDEIINTIIRHAKMLIEAKGEYIGIREMRKQAAWYTKGMKNAAKIRTDINKIETIDMLKMQLEILREA